ncbi:MAG TPA: cytochrome C [Planktothrix sp. UBA8407]|nr:cytochrome C [Planktothrix sp. UBA8407]
MGFLSQSRMKNQKRRYSPWVLVVIVGVWSIGIALGMVQTMNAAPTSNQIGNVDEIKPGSKLGHELYLSTCSNCHIPIPPEVFPTQTWQQVIQDPQHYGATLQPLEGPSLLLMWKYLQTYSRPIALKDETIPYRFNRSRYFKALHPRVEISQPLTVNSCVSCHPGASQFDFRSLTSEWQNSP